MGNIKLEAGKYYRTRGGRKVFVAGIAPFESVTKDCQAVGFAEHSSCVWGWAIDGKYLLSRNESVDDIVAEWKEPKRIKGWLSIYPANEHVYFYETKQQAIDMGTNGYGKFVPVALIEIDVLEGEGLEKAS